MKKRFAFAGALALAVCGASALVNGAVLYSQADFSDGGWFSDADAGQFFNVRAADSFTLSSASEVDGVRWWGSSENFTTPGYGNFVNFIVEIYPDVGGLPGAAPIYSSGLVPTAATSPVNTGLLNVLGGQIHEQQLNFAPLPLAAGTYWLSIGSDNVPAGDDGWAWANTVSVYNNAHAGRSPAIGGTWSSASEDLAFEIRGEVPEPASLGLMVLGAGILGLRRRCETGTGIETGN